MPRAAVVDGRTGPDTWNDEGPAPAATTLALERGPASPSLLEKAEQVLGAFDRAHPRLSLTEIIRRSGLSRSSAHRILDQLVRLRWLERDGREYHMGMRLLEHGGLAAHHNRLLRAAQPRLDALHEATGKLVQLFVLDGTDVVCLERVGSLDDRALPAHVGARLPAHCSAAGKAILGFGDPADVERVVDTGLPARTPRTVTRPLLFRTELASVRESGVAWDRHGTCRGLVSVAVPLRGAGRAIAAVSVSSTGNHRTQGQLVPTLQSCARSIWTELYGPGRAARFAPPVEAPPARVPVPMDNMMRWARIDGWM
ncbi:IclR family transcriptional regulator [Streptomyces sp. NPDC046821]|uniref:IclR family transcriptional regulator n=1 Tax=Streptomyces sp. NPDC046821 TaxID=3154702 RepID=UPI003408EDE8